MLRLIERRLYEKTDEFREKYRKRSGIEGLFGRLKQTTVLRRLRIRGKVAVFNNIYSILTGHKIMQMAKFYKMKPVQEQKIVTQSIQTGFAVKSFSLQRCFALLENLLAA